MPFELRLTPADGSFWSRSPIDEVPDLMMSSDVSVRIGPTESASLRPMRDPVTMMSPPPDAVAASSPDACACASVGQARAPRLIPAAAASLAR